MPLQRFRYYRQYGNGTIVVSIMDWVVLVDRSQLRSLKVVRERTSSIKSCGFIIRNVLKVFNYQFHTNWWDVEYGWIIDATFNKISESLIFFVSVHYCDNRICVLLDISKMFIEGVGHFRRITNTFIFRLNKWKIGGCRFSWSNSFESFPEFPWIIHIFGDLVPHIIRLGLGNCLYHLVTLSFVHYACKNVWRALNQCINFKMSLFIHGTKDLCFTLFLTMGACRFITSLKIHS